MRPQRWGSVVGRQTVLPAHRNKDASPIRVWVMVPALVDFHPLASAQRDRYGVSDQSSTTQPRRIKTKDLSYGTSGRRYSRSAHSIVVLNFAREILSTGAELTSQVNGSISMGPKGRSYEYRQPFRATASHPTIRGGRALVCGPDTFAPRKSGCRPVAGPWAEHISADDHEDTAMERPAQAGGVSAFFRVPICPCGCFSPDPSNCALRQRGRRIRRDAW